MPKRTERGDALFDMLDGVITLRRHLERENLPAGELDRSDDLGLAVRRTVILDLFSAPPRVLAYRSLLRQAVIATSGRFPQSM